MVRTYKALSLFPRGFRIYYKPRAVDPGLIRYKENPKSMRDVAILPIRSHNLLQTRVRYSSRCSFLVLHPS